MKRTPVVAAAVLAGAIPFQKELTEEECKDRACITEVTATVPDQPHGLDEAIGYEPFDYIVVMSSPINIKRRTPEVLESAGQQGLGWRNATLDEIGFIRGLERGVS